MKDCIRIYNSDASLLVKALLVIKELVAPTPTVRLLYIDAIAEGEFIVSGISYNMLQLESAVIESKHGISLSIDEAIALSRIFKAVTDVTMVLYGEGQEPIGKDFNHADLKEKYYALLEIFDSTNTDVYCHDENVFRAIESALK